MEQLKVYKFLEKKKEFLFPNEEFTEDEVQSALLAITDNFDTTMNNIPFRKPSTVQIISVFPGSLGVDRFYLGDIVKGILKYFTFGGFGIWWIVDIFSAKKRCRAYNCKKLMDSINDPSVAIKMNDTDDKLKKAFQVAKAAAPAVKAVKDGFKDINDTFYVN